MSSLDLKALSESSEFLAASPEAKRLFLSKHVPEFGKASQEAQTLFIEKHFPREATAVAPTKSFWSRAGEAALRTGGPMVGGALASAAAPEAIPLSTMAGMAAGSAAVSKLYRDPPREALTEAGVSGAFGAFGPGKTAVRGAIKYAGLGAGSTVIDEIARTGELPTKGHLALSALIGGTIGYFGKALPDWLSRKLTSRAHIEEILPKDIAADAEKVLEGKPVKGVPAEESYKIRELRTRLRIIGKFIGRKNVEELRMGSSPYRVYKPGFQHDPKGRFLAREQMMHELSKEDIFPEYNPAGDDIHRLIGLGDEPVPTATKLSPGTAASAGISRPRWLAAHVEQQTGIPVYSDVLKSLEKAYGDRERTAVVVDHIVNTYLKDRSLDPAVKDIIGRYAVAVQGVEDSRELMYAIQRTGELFGKKIPDDVARRWRNNALSAPYAATMPLRIGAVLRVFAHTFQIGVMKTGWSYLGRGMSRAMTREGWREAMRAGVIGAEHLSVPEEVLGPTKEWYQRALEFGFGPFRFSQDMSRTTIFHATREQARDALRVAKTFEQFVDKAGLDVGIPKPEVQKARFLWTQGRFTELADHVGATHVTSYIPGHTNLDRPFYASGVMSGQATALARGARPERLASPRFALQFSNWPSFYGQTMFENFREGPRAKRALMFGRFVMANAALGTVAYELYGGGKEAIQKVSSLVGIGPALYGLGPGVADVMNFVKGESKVWQGAVETVAGDDAEVGGKHAMQGFRQMGKALPIPFKGAVQDLYSHLLGEEE